MIWVYLYLQSNLIPYLLPSFTFSNTLLFQFLSSTVLVHVLQEADAKTLLDLQVTLVKDRGEGARQEKESPQTVEHRFNACEGRAQAESKIAEQFQGFSEISKESLNQSLLLKESYVSQKWSCIRIPKCA